MPAFPVSMKQCWFTTRGVMVGVLAACTLAACTHVPVAPEGQPGTAAGAAEVNRLAETRLQLAVLHFEEGRAEVALGEIAQALQAAPRYVDAYNLRGWIYLSQQNPQAAQDSFMQALALRPGDADTLYNLGWAQCQQQQWALANKNFDAALQASRLNAQVVPRTWLAKGVCLRQAGDISRAIVALEKAHEMDPGNPAVAYNFADVLHASGDSGRARFYVRRMNNGQWATAESLWLGIKVERKLGDHVAMRQLADQLNRRFPDSKEWQRFERGAFDE